MQSLSRRENITRISLNNNYFGIWEIGRYGFTIFAFLVSIWLIFSSFKLPRYSSLGFVLIASGAIGNAIDRIIYGKVVDFIDFHIGNFHWFIFNIADIFITFGIFFLIFLEFTDITKDKI